MGAGSGGTEPLSAFTSQLGNAFSGLTGGSQFGGDASAALTGDTSGFDVASLFSNLGSDAFNQGAASIQATQAITPPAQAEANVAQGQDPSAGVGGTQTGAQTASTGPSGQNQNQPSQDQQEQEQEQRNKAIDELRQLFRQREKQQQQPPQWHPRYAATPISPQAATDAGLSASNISPDAAVRAGLLDPSLIDPATGTIRRDQPAPAEDPPESSVTESVPRLYSPGDVPRLYSPGDAPGVHDLPPSAADPSVEPPYTGPPPGRAVVPYTGGAPQAPSGLGAIGGGLDSLASRALPWLAPPIGALTTLLGSTTPAETGELPEKYWPKPPYRPEDDPRPTPPDAPKAPAAPAPAAIAPKPKDQPKAVHKPKAVDPPRRVWVPPTPGHYVPTTGNVRGPATWVPGTPGHYVDSPAPGQGRPLAASRTAASVSPQRMSEARAEAPAAPPEAMAYNQDATMPALLRDIAGLGVIPGTLAALAGRSRQFPPNTPSNVYGQGGTRPYNENWGGAAYVAKGDEVQRGRQYMGYLTNKGLTRQGAAALLGNAHQESNLAATLAPGGDGGTAAGMFQWRGPRQAAFRRWLATNGRSESDPQAHLDFALLEMQSNPAYRPSWDALHNPNMTPAQIADIIANNYEGSKPGPTQGMNNRIGFANSMLQGGGATAAAPAPVPIQASGGDARA